ncbi:unnamed protein product [Ixodes pacificus]
MPSDEAPWPKTSCGCHCCNVDDSKSEPDTGRKNERPAKAREMKSQAVNKDRTSRFLAMVCSEIRCQACIPPQVPTQIAHRAWGYETLWVTHTAPTGLWSYTAPIGSLQDPHSSRRPTQTVRGPMGTYTPTPAHPNRLCGDP